MPGGGERCQRRCGCVKRWAEFWVGVGRGLKASCGGRCGGIKRFVPSLVCLQTDVVGGGDMRSGIRDRGYWSWW